jgi:hypothetical protein
LSSLKTLLIPAQEHRSRTSVNVSADSQLMAGFEVSPNGRFWVPPETSETIMTRVAGILSPAAHRGIIEAVVNVLRSGLQ